MPKMKSSGSNLVAWKDSYALGMDEIDDQHKMLFDLINRCWQAIVENSGHNITIEILEELERYTILHFTEEEVFMRSMKYPNIDAHVAMHSMFVQKIVDEKLRARNGDRVSLDLLHFLRNWLANHILIEDKRYVTQFHTEKRPKSLLGRFFANF